MSNFPAGVYEATLPKNYTSATVTWSGCYVYCGCNKYDQEYKDGHGSLNVVPQMLSEHQNKNANYLRILMTLRALRQSGDITEKEYRRAKKYYQNLTGADIVLTD